MERRWCVHVWRTSAAQFSQGEEGQKVLLDSVEATQITDLLGCLLDPFMHLKHVKK